MSINVDLTSEELRPFRAFLLFNLSRFLPSRLIRLRESLSFSFARQRNQSIIATDGVLSSKALFNAARCRLSDIQKRDTSSLTRRLL
jgi:hypothetical protein